MPSVKGARRQAKASTGSKSRTKKTKAASPRTVAGKKLSAKSPVVRTAPSAGRAKAAQAKATATEKVVSRKVGVAIAKKEKDRAKTVQTLTKKQATKVEHVKVDTAKSHVNKPASVAANARVSGNKASGKRAVAAATRTTAAVPGRKDVKVSQPPAVTVEKKAPKPITTPPVFASSKPAKAAPDATVRAKPPIAAGSSGPAAPPDAALPPVPHPQETSERIQVTEKKNVRAAASPAPIAKAAAAARADHTAAESLPAEAKAPADKSAAVRASSAAVARAAAASPPAVPAPANKPAVAKPAGEPTKVAASKSGAHRTGFKTSEFIVYPAHGVGQIIAIEEQEVAGFKLELFVINFVKDKMTLKVPLPKVVSGAIRKLAEPETAKKSLDTLTGRARIKRTMWSRRAQEYEAKINSGDLIAIAEVVRDLYRSDAQPEQSYSERQLYEAALDRMAREIAAVQRLTETEALKLIDTHLQRGPRRGVRGDASADEAADAEDGDIEEAA